MNVTCNLRIATGTDAGTLTASGSDADNLNLLNDDSVDTDGNAYKSKPIAVLSSGTAYSYERWAKLEFKGTFNAITAVKFYKSAGTLSDSGLDVMAGTTATGATPVNTASSVATTTLTSWDAVGEAIDITPSGGITSDGDMTDFMVFQLSAADTTTTPGDIGTLTVTFTYNVS
jgi:hypothetical protein